MAWAGWAAVGAALVVGGVILGASLTSSGTPAPPAPPAPQTVCGSAIKAAGHQPVLCMNQSQGFPSTSFVVEGGGFTPRTSVTVVLSEVGMPPANKQLFSVTSPVKPVVGPDGTFKVPVSELYSGQLSPGLCTVEATPSDGSQAQTQFMVIPAAAPPAGTLPSG